MHSVEANHPPTVQSHRQMSEWIAHSKELFTQSLAEVGQNHQHALDLQTQHQHFTANCMVRPAALRDTLIYTEGGSYKSTNILLLYSRRLFNFLLKSVYFLTFSV